MSKLGDRLLAIASLLEPEGAWTQGESARDKHGELVDERSRRACRWCLLGAASRVSKTTKEYDEIIEAIAAELGPDDADRWDVDQLVLRFNDAEGRTQADVIAVVRHAAEAAA